MGDVKAKAVQVDETGADAPLHRFLHSWVKRPTDGVGENAFDTPISFLTPYISGHVVANNPICPASVYLEQILAGLSLLGYEHPVTLHDIQFLKPLVESSDTDVVVRIIIRSDSFTITSRTTTQEITHVQGLYNDCHETLRALSNIPKFDVAQSFSTLTLYEHVFCRIVTYSKKFYAVQSLILDDTGKYGTAIIKLPSPTDHTIFLDAILHVPGLMVNLLGTPGDTFICVGIGSVRTPSQLPDDDRTYTLSCIISDANIPNVRTATALVFVENQIVAEVKEVKFQRLTSSASKFAHPRSAATPTLPTTLSQSGLANDILRIIADACHIDPSDIDQSSSLDAIGLDSLISIEISGVLRMKYGPTINVDFLDCHSISHVVQQVILQQSLANPLTVELLDALSLDVNPRPVQTEGNVLPFFTIHDGSGLTNYYERLAPLGRPLYAIHNPNFKTAKPWKNLIMMAASYAVLIRRTTKASRVILGGWSFGGVVAYEIAYQLVRWGITVEGIVLIDAPNPIHYVPLSPVIIEHIISRHRRKSINSLLTAQFGMNSSLLSAHHPTKPSGSCNPRLIMLRSREAFTLPGHEVPLWFSDRSNPRSVVTGWEELSGATVDIRDIPGNHFQAFEPENILATGEAINQACNDLEGFKY